MLFIGYVDENNDELNYVYARKIMQLPTRDLVAILGDPDDDSRNASTVLNVNDIFSIAPSDGRVVCVRGTNGENTVLAKWQRQNWGDWIGQNAYDILEMDKECKESKYLPGEYIMFDGNPISEAILDVHLKGYSGIGRRAKNELINGVKIQEVHCYPGEFTPIWYRVDVNNMPIEVPEIFMTFCY